MKFIVFLCFSVFGYSSLKSQEVKDMPGNGSLTNSFADVYKKKNPGLKYSYLEVSQIHNYSGNWDIDGDKKPDSVFFIGNHGAHIYYHLRIILSSDKKVRDFEFISIDFPLLESLAFFKKNGKAGSSIPQFVVGDFNQDTKPDLYISINTKQTSIPVSWKKKGVTSGHLLINFRNNKLVVENFKFSVLQSATAGLKATNPTDVCLLTGAGVSQQLRHGESGSGLKL